MAQLLAILAVLISVLYGCLVVVKVLQQEQRDRQRTTYRISFPADLDPERVTAWIRSISGTMRVKGVQRMFGSVPTLALELVGTNQGIVHLLHIPWMYEPHVRPKLESLVPGVRLTKDVPRRRVWVHAVEAGLKQKQRTIRVYQPADIAHAILTNFAQLGPEETLLMQWVISPIVPAHKPSYQEANGQLSRDAISEMRDKLDEPNLGAVLRIAAVASTPKRARYMVNGVVSTLESTRSASTRFYKRLFLSKKDLQERIDSGGTPVLGYPIQLSAPELAALIGWRYNNANVPGLPAPVSRYLHAPLSVPDDQLVIGNSNAPGNERPIAIPWTELVKHAWVSGGTGSGKSTLLGNMFKQAVDAGLGAIVIETKGDLFETALNYIPKRRLADVIVFDVQDVTRPIGFNILRQGDPRVIVDEIGIIFNKLFADRPSLWLQESIYYGLQTLAASPDGTLIDLPSLVAPDADEVAWADSLQRSVKDSQIRAFWSRFEASGKLRQDQRMEPLMTRMFTLMRANLINILGQSDSSFQMPDVIRDNKILLVNLAKLEQVSATLTGTILTNAVWNAVKVARGQYPNLLFLDELQSIAALPIDTEEMLAKARSFNLGMVLANQGAYQLPGEVYSAITTNAKTKVIFQTGEAADARKFADNFGSSVSKEDFTNLRQFEAVARISTDNGVSQPVTLQTRPPAKGYGHANQIRQLSRQKYGRDLQAVQTAMLARRRRETPGTKRRPPITDTGLTFMGD